MDNLPFDPQITLKTHEKGLKIDFVGNATPPDGHNFDFETVLRHFCRFNEQEPILTLNQPSRGPYDVLNVIH